MKVYARTDIGRKRPINEDSYYVPVSDERFCAVADGMGGHSAGEVASAMAVKVFAENMRKLAGSPEGNLRTAVERANAAIRRAAEDDPANGDMGTTFTALYIYGGVAYVAHVGDSRAYLIRHGAAMRLTTDHTLVEALVLEGVISLSQAQNHPQRNYITRALGVDEKVEVDIIRVDIEPDDVFMLCSDGLSNCVSEADMIDIFSKDITHDERLKLLIDMALEAGGNDNITALIASVGGNEE